MKAEIGQELRAGNYAGQSPPGANTSAMPGTPFAGAHHYAISFRGTAPILLQSRSLSCFGRPCWEKGGFTFLLASVGHRHLRVVHAPASFRHGPARPAPLMARSAQSRGHRHCALADCRRWNRCGEYASSPSSLTPKPANCGGLASKDRVGPLRRHCDHHPRKRRLSLARPPRITGSSPARAHQTG